MEVASTFSKPNPAQVFDTIRIYCFIRLVF